LPIHVHSTSNTHSHEQQESASMSNEHELAMSSKVIGTIKERETEQNKQSQKTEQCQQRQGSQSKNQEQDQDDGHLIPHVDTLSLLSPDLNDVLSSSSNVNGNGNENINGNGGGPNPNESEPIKETVFKQCKDYVIYGDTKLSGQNMTDFLAEKEKLEHKLNDAMESYQKNNVQYLSNIMQQYRTQKLKICQEITDGPAQDAFLKKLQKDLEILDDSLKRQFEESKNTLQHQLTTIHHKRLREFATKLQQHTEEVEELKKPTHSGQMQAGTKCNHQCNGTKEEQIVNGVNGMSIEAEHKKEMSQQTEDPQEERLIMTQLETTTNVTDINIPKVNTSTSSMEVNDSTVGTTSSKSRENFSVTSKPRGLHLHHGDDGRKVPAVNVETQLSHDENENENENHGIKCDIEGGIESVGGMLEERNEKATSSESGET